MMLQRYVDMFVYIIKSVIKMDKYKYKYNALIISIMIFSLTQFLIADPGQTCAEAVDYELINGNETLSGSFQSEGEDYWIKFSTSCSFRDITLSSCGSYATVDGWVDTFLEVYTDCNDYQSFNYDQLQEEPNTNWWNADAPQDLECNTNNEDFDGEQYHAVLLIPSPQEQAIGVQIQPGTYYARISAQNPAGNNDQPGDWELSISGRATVAAQVGNQELSLPHNPNDGAPGGNMTVALDASESICTEQVQDFEWVQNWLDAGDCEEGFIKDCSDDDCCSIGWIGDGVADCEDQSDGCDLTCYSNDGGDCGDVEPISGPSEDVVQYVSLDYGTHSFTLNMTDLMGVNYSDDFTISIDEPNTGPTSNAAIDTLSTFAIWDETSWNITIPHDGSIDTDVITVRLIGDDSNDPEDDILSFYWEKISGPNDIALSDPNSNTPTFNAFNPFGSEPKEYEFELTVTDPYGLSDTDTMLVTIYPEENTEPTAETPDLQINILHDGDPDTFNTEEFVLNGSESYDLDGDNITSYMWFDSELDTLSEIAYYTGLINYSTLDSVLGDHNFTLVVSDSYNAVGSTSMTLTVGPEQNTAPVVQFNPPIAEFMMNPDDNPGGSQMVVLDVYNDSYDPDNYDDEGNELPDELKTDTLIHEWFDEDGNPALSLQNLSAGQSNFTLRVTDPYGASSESVFVVLISEPNVVPSVVTNVSEVLYESTADLNEDNLPDTLSLNGFANDPDHPNDLGARWFLIEENPLVTILNDSSLTGTFLSDEVLHNDYPINLDFSLTVWDPFSCYMYNTESFEDTNNNGQWDEGEVWDSFCINGQDPDTYGEAPLSIAVINYNQSPQIFSENYSIDPVVMNEDESKDIYFDYNLWSDNNFFSDVDDCEFNIDTNECISYYRYKCDQGNSNPDDDIYFDELDACQDLCAIEDGCEEQFTVNLLDGENYSVDNSLLIPDLNYFGTLMVPFQINDNNESNNLSETIMLEVEVLPINDIPTILSFNDNQLIEEGVLEESQFTINIQDLTFYDVEGDQNGDGECGLLECENMSLALTSSENYSFVGDDIVILTQDFFGDLEVGLQVFDGEDYSDPFYITIPVENVNDRPNLIFGMDTVYFYEDFGDSVYNLGNIFEDVDGDQLFYEKFDQNGDLFFNSEVSGDELIMSSFENSFGLQEMYFEVSDGIDPINETIVFSILPVDDSPEVLSDTLYTDEYSINYVPLEISLRASDIDSEDVFFEILEGNEYGPHHGSIPPGPDAIEYIGLENGYLTALVNYTPYEGYRCADSLTYRANDYNSYSDELATIIINVGDCNQSPELIVNLSSSINIAEDSPIYFFENNENMVWCLDDDNQWSQIDENSCNGFWQDYPPNNYIPLNDIDYFEILDGDQDLGYIEIWESDNYYIEDGYCASPNNNNDWYINTEVECGLISPNEVCLSAPAIDVGYEDGYMYCPCDAEETCTASQKFLSNDEMNFLSIRPKKDYDLSFDIVMIANDDNPTYNLSQQQYVSVVINPINDPPSIGVIENQEIDEGEILELGYSSYQSDLTIFDIDSDQLTIYQDSSPSVLFMINEDNQDQFSYVCPDSTICLKTINSNWNGYAQVYITVDDNDILNPGTATSQFTLTVNQVDDQPEFTELTVEDTNENLITFIEDTNPVTYDEEGNPILFAREIKIYYTDDDWNPSVNDNPEEQFIPNEINLLIESASNNPKVIFSPYLDPNPMEDPITNELYYSQLIVLDEIVEPDWNGIDGLNFTINGESSFYLEVMVTPQNDAPNDINQVSSNIVSYNQNFYEWSNSEIEISICQDVSGAQGVYNFSNQECDISNFFIDADGFKNYRLPYRRYPTNEIVAPDLMTFKWLLTEDVDRNYEDLDIFYRIELIDSLSNRAIVLKDLINHSDFEDLGEIEGQVELDLSQLFFSYNLDLNYYDYCEHSNSLTLSDISEVYLDLTGKTKYTWRVLANNGQNCDELNLDPNSTFASCSYVESEQTCDSMHYCEWLINATHYECGSQYTCSNTGQVYSIIDNCILDCGDAENCIISSYDSLDICVASGCQDGFCYEVIDNESCAANNGNDFYIDLVPPLASISISQNSLAPDLMELFVSFDESINYSKSQIFIMHDSYSDGYNLEQGNQNDIYNLVRPFPGTGIITFNIESWDEVGNGLISTRSITYEEISSSNSSNTSSPDELFLIKFEENDIASDASLLIQRKEYHDISSRYDIQRISDTYNLSSVDMEIINDIDVEVVIPNEYDNFDNWKFRLYNNEHDITSFTKNGIVYGKLKELGNVTLYYDSSVEFYVPENLELVGNYPNPFNPSTSIYYFVQESNSAIRISILDLLGREVNILYDGISDIGYYELNWDGTNNAGYQLGSGIYFISAKIGDEQLYKKVMKLK